MTVPPPSRRERAALAALILGLSAALGVYAIVAVPSHGAGQARPARPNAPAAHDRTRKVVPAEETLPTRDQSSMPDGGQPIVIRFSHVAARETVKGRTAERFKEWGEARTKGRVRIEAYHDSNRHKDLEELQALSYGSVQMLAVSLPKLAQLGVPDFEVFALPYLFPNEASFAAIADGPVGKRLFEQLEARGLKSLVHWSNGFQVMSAKQPLRDVSDLVGRRMRVQSSRTLIEQMRVFEAEPVVTGFDEQYARLRLTDPEAIDGTENVPSNFLTQRLYEVQPYLTVSNHTLLAYAVIVNKNFWDDLPPDVREALEGALRDATRDNSRLAAEENKEALRQLRARKLCEVHDQSPSERAAWKRAAVCPLDHKASGWISARTMRDVRDTLKWAEGCANVGFHP